jgi:hypothetical protein
MLLAMRSARPGSKIGTVPRFKVDVFFLVVIDTGYIVAKSARQAPETSPT